MVPIAGTECSQRRAMNRARSDGSGSYCSPAVPTSLPSRDATGDRRCLRKVRPLARLVRMVTEAERLAAHAWRTTRLRSGIPVPDVRSGALRIFGEWFGRPFDNQHTVIDIRADGDQLIVTFNGAEVLTVSDPAEASIHPGEFWIKGASRVRWEWHEYGRPPGSGPSHVLEYWIDSGQVFSAQDGTTTQVADGLSWPSAELA